MVDRSLADSTGGLSKESHPGSGYLETLAILYHLMGSLCAGTCAASARMTGCLGATDAGSLLHGLRADVAAREKYLCQASVFWAGLTQAAQRSVAHSMPKLGYKLTAAATSFLMSGG